MLVRTTDEVRFLCRFQMLIFIFRDTFFYAPLQRLIDRQGGHMILLAPTVPGNWGFFFRFFFHF